MLGYGRMTLNIIMKLRKTSNPVFDLKQIGYGGAAAGILAQLGSKVSTLSGTSDIAENPLPKKLAKS